MSTYPPANPTRGPVISAEPDIDPPGAASSWLGLVGKYGLSTVLVVVLLGYLLWDRVTTTTAMLDSLQQLRDLQAQTVVLLQQQTVLLASWLRSAP